MLPFLKSLIQIKTTGTCNIKVCGAGVKWFFKVKYGKGGVMIHNKFILIISRKESNFVDCTFSLNGMEWCIESGKTSNEYIHA